jgi:MerR family redox-sensitive transcriptional activator SoxR
MPGMSIGEVARKMGLNPSAIRYYERLGLLPKPPRKSGRRQYDDDVLQRLMMVRFAQHVGFSMVEIKLLLDGVHGRPPTERWRKLAREKAAQVDEFIAHAKAVRAMLHDTLAHQCPKLVERGAALALRPQEPSVRVRRRDARPAGRTRRG